MVTSACLESPAPSHVQGPFALRVLGPGLWTFLCLYEHCITLMPQTNSTKTKFPSYSTTRTTQVSWPCPLFSDFFLFRSPLVLLVSTPIRRFAKAFACSRHSVPPPRICRCQAVFEALRSPPQRKRSSGSARFLLPRWGRLADHSPGLEAGGGGEAANTRHILGWIPLRGMMRDMRALETCGQG